MFKVGIRHIVCSRNLLYSRQCHHSLHFRDFPKNKEPVYYVDPVTGEKYKLVVKKVVEDDKDKSK